MNCSHLWTITSQYSGSSSIRNARRPVCWATLPPRTIGAAVQCYEHIQYHPYSTTFDPQAASGTRQQTLKIMPNMLPQAFSNIHQFRHALADRIISDTKALIDARPIGSRNQGVDDAIFSPANDGIILAIGHRDLSMAREIFVECYDHALQYEVARNCEMHKGSITFNIGIAYLRSYDFAGALHYFELAEEETRMTTGQKNWNIFLTPDLFDPNFWDTLDAAEKCYPLVVHQELWGTPFSKDAGKGAWRKLSSHSKLLYIISAARRIHLRQLETGSRWSKSHSLKVGYWNLIADLSRLLETEVYRRADLPTPKPYQLKTLLKQGFTSTVRGDISTLINGCMNARNIHDTTSYNASYPDIKKDIQDTNLTARERVAHAAHLLYATRNQVQHHVDRKLILYKSVDEAKFTSDVLLSLCRLSAWAKKK